MSLYVAASKIILDYYGNQALASKRREIEGLLSDIRRHHNVSAVEVADFDDLERCVIGLSLSAGTEKTAREAMKKVLEYIDSHAFARVVLEDTDVFGYD